MAWDYGFGELENELIEAGRECPPNYEKMRELLAAGADINAISSEEYVGKSVLSAILCGYPDIELPEECQYCDKESESACKECPHRVEISLDGRELPHICDFFLANGFDVHSSNDLFGSYAITNLVWSSYDRYILDATKTLLHAGANPICELGRHDTLMDAVATAASAARCCDEDHNIENLFETMYCILEAASENRDYDSIEYFPVAVGRKVERIEMYCEAGELPVFPMNEPEFQQENCFKGTIVLWCEEKALNIDKWTNIMVDPTVTLSADKNAFDMEPYFADCIGSILESIDFSHENTAEGTTLYGRSITHLHFSNGKSIYFSNNFGKTPENKYAAFFTM